MIIGVDVDGIIANFQRDYQELFVKLTGESRWPGGIPYAPPRWDYATHSDVGYTKEEDAKVWKYIEESPNFWANLPGYPDTQKSIDRLWNLQKSGHDVYFITNRSGKTAKAQTESFIYQYTPSMLPPPTVIVSAQKGLSCTAINASVYIDDKPSNCRDVIKARGLATKVFILDRTWNQEEDSKYIARVGSVDEMLDIVLPLREGAVA